MKNYEAVFDEKKNDGVYAISLVEKPAMEGFFVALKDESNIQFSSIDEEQRILIGLVLEPNKPIYRNNNGEEFTIVFSEKTIKELSYNFFKSNFHKNSTIEHSSSDEIQGITFVESWIVEDPKRDKSAVYGFDYPKGSWVTTMKVDNEDIWQDYIKSGKVKGYSIDAILSLKEIKSKSKSKLNMSKEIKQSLADIADSIKLSLGLLGSKEVKDATSVSMSEEEEVAEQVEEVAEEPKDESAPTMDQIMSAIGSIAEHIEAMSKEIEALKASNSEVKASVVELADQPAALKVISKPVQSYELNTKGRILNKLRSK